MSWTEVLGRVIKLGEGHYTIVHGLPSIRLDGGRLPGRKKPVPKSRQEKGKKYCTKCRRPLNLNNQRGKCHCCTRHKKVLVD